MNELLEQFIVEGRDLVAAAESALDALGSRPDDRAALDGLFRAVHTLKGSVVLFDMGPAERLLHLAEDRLAQCTRAPTGVDQELFAVLVAVIDLVDHWIDEMEASECLGPDAAGLAAKLLARLGGENPPENQAPADDGQWISTLEPRLSTQLSATDVPLVSFRYSPDADCFFRGEDPLAIIAAVPDLIDLEIKPVEAWPELAAWDPFRCLSILEGISRASLQDVRAAFRLVPDQVQFAEVAPARGDMGHEAQSTVRVDARRLNKLADEVGELFVATNGLAHLAREAAAIDPHLAERLRAILVDFERIGSRIHGTVNAVRRVPLAPALRRLPRLVREISESLGKTVRFEMSGQSVEVDKAIADQIFEPLLHLVRNAVDHGIEPTEMRAAAGKKQEASLTLSASIQGDELLLALRDDGRGIDPGLIRDTAILRGLLSRDEVDAMDDMAALRLILRPGFSTARQVSELSGRGVGMDSVQTMVEQLGGLLQIGSEVGIGTTMTLRLPLDMITTRLLVIHSGAERFGVRLDQIVETTRVPAEEIKSVGTGHACVLRDRTVPVMDLGDLLGQASAAGPLSRLVVTEAHGQPVALRVDAFGQRIDARVQAAEGLLNALPGIAGTALMGDGKVLLILDLPELVA